MDPVGTTASLVTLLSITLKAAKLTDDLLRNYRDAPVELVRLKHKTNGIKSQLALLQYAQQAVRCNVFDLADTDIVNTLEGFIRDTIPVFSAICNHFEEQSLTDRLGKTGRLKWAIRDASRIKAWDVSLQRQSADLANVLLLLNLRASSLLHLKVEGQQHATSAELLGSSTPSQARLSWAKFFNSSQWIIPLAAKFQGSVFQFEREKKYVYGVSLRFYVLFCPKVLSVDFKLRHNSMFSMNCMSFDPGLRLRNLVSPDAEVMTACLMGDIETVWSLFQSGKASVNDVTQDNRSPLFYAMKSGSTELVSFLINNGADVNEYSGGFQSNLVNLSFSFRQVDCARMLISRGADVHHINAKGWTPAFSIFGFIPEAHRMPCNEYLEILSAASFADFDAQDGEGWTCMHRAAAFGNAQDIKLLLKCQASTSSRTIKVSWMPIFCAVQFGNISTFNELRKVHPDYLDLRDIRKWSLLHLAVNAQRLDMLELLISLGADPHARTLATEFLVPDDLKGQSLTPGDIASLRAEDVLSRYVGALRRCGHDLEVARDGVDNESDIFWPSAEV